MYSNLFILLILLYFGLLKSYTTGYKFYDVYPENIKQTEVINKLVKNAKYEFFQLKSSSVDKPSRVAISPEDEVAFEKILQQANIKYKIVGESPTVIDKKEGKIGDDLIDFKRFLTLTEIYTYLVKIAASYPQRVILRAIGKSYENRDIYCITITNDPNNIKNNSVIIIDAGMHSREWISHAGALYIINRLVEHYPKHWKLLRCIDWMIIPVLNPDGYVYTHRHNRLWRKTLQRYTDTNCVGADINRNFPYKWVYKNISCTEMYGGPQPFSESETRALRDVLLAIKNRAILYISLHAPGRMILYPWAWTLKAPSNRREHHELATAAAEAMYKFSHKLYRVGSPPDVLYSAIGANLDYVFGVVKIPNAFVFEMPGDNFQPPAKAILPYATETWIGIKTIARKLAPSHLDSENIAKSTINIKYKLNKMYLKLSFVVFVTTAIFARYIARTLGLAAV